MIKRWKPYHDRTVICNCGIDLDDNGSLVHYSDHKALIAEKDAGIKRLRDAIQGALRIDVLWVPKVADEEHWEEARALHLMRQSFLEALKETT